MSIPRFLVNYFVLIVGIIGGSVATIFSII